MSIQVSTSERNELISQIGIDNLDIVAKAIWGEFSWSHAEWGQGSWEVLECRRAAAAAIIAFMGTKRRPSQPDPELLRIAKRTIDGMDRLLQTHRAMEARIFKEMNDCGEMVPRDGDNYLEQAKAALRHIGIEPREVRP